MTEEVSDGACIIRDCNNEDDAVINQHGHLIRTVALFSFPRNPEFAIKWLRFAGEEVQPDEYRQNHTKYRKYRICSDHFSHSDVEVKAIVGGRPKINKTAIPCFKGPDSLDGPVLETKETHSKTTNTSDIQTKQRPLKKRKNIIGMPNSKKRGKGGGGRSVEKEKPLLTVQGVLRLEKSFISPSHEDADYIEVPGADREKNKTKILLIPGCSEHELVDYKAGYDIGPENPFPTNEPEVRIFEERKAVEKSQEAFQKLKEQSEAEKKARNDAFSSHPTNYDNAPLPFGESLQPPGEESHEEKDKTDTQNQANKDESSESKESCQTENMSRAELDRRVFEEQSIRNMALSVALEMEEKRKKECSVKEVPEEKSENEDTNIYSLNQMTVNQLHQEQEDANRVGPQISQDQLVKAAENNPGYDAKMLLESYWSFVKENPRDFNGWTYLVQQAESLDILDEIRLVYNSFLPIYPYCFAYWIRYSDIERKKNNWERSLAILHRGLEAIPLSVDLWITYLELYRKLYKHHDKFDELFRDKCENAITSVGLEYKSDGLWERYIEWESERKNFRHVTKIFRRLVALPTKLYNKHWDNFIAHIRDHHPRDILEYPEYEQLRRITCKELGLTYRPDPVIEPSLERIVASVIGDHEKTELLVDEIYRFEEKIKRSYFHVRSLDAKQLKNWDSYLDYEIKKENHERIIVLFERCLIPCANYEQFWIKYARYLENFFRDSLKKSNELYPSLQEHRPSILDLEKARWSFGTGLSAVDQLKEKRCAWTLRGWKEEDEEGNEVMRVVSEPVSFEDQTISQEKDENTSMECEEHSSHDVKDFGKENETQEPSVSNENHPCTSTDTKSRENCLPTETDTLDNISTSLSCDDRIDEISKAFQKEIEAEMSTVLKTSWSNDINYEAVRSVYKRACHIHCPSKALVQLKWAAFEEECGKLDSAMEILTDLSKTYPLLLECCMQMIDIQRRQGTFDKVDEMYKKLIKKIPQNRKNIKTWASMKYARFLFKIVGNTEKALGVLRAALKRERGEPRLYSQIIDICYQRSPIDVPGFTAAIELALNSSELTYRQKFEFAKRKTEFLQEFGDVKRYRDACDQLKIYRSHCAQELKLESKKKKELEKEEQKLKELEEIKAKTRAMANMKAKIAESDGKLMCTHCQKSMYPNAQEKISNLPEEEEGVVDLLDMAIPEDQAQEIQKSLKESTKYKEVAPTWELNIETYGYENMKAPGFGSSKLDESNIEDKPAYTTSDYILPPKVPQLVMGPGIGPMKPNETSEEEAKPDIFELPPEIANPQKSPCVNVPEWFIKDGGELCLSDTSNGISVIRYWPKFLSDKGNHLMFNRLRKYCKWHQKQVKIGGEWKYETRLVAWYGPCDYIHSGLNLEKNLNWAPELLDLLHRLISMTNTEFNSCFANLYRHGHDMCGWHADVHPQLGRNPDIASISLGVVRVFEFRKKSGPPNFIRFPLFPGSLLVMEGATQEDWLHCLPRDVNCKEERINLTFRTMYSIDKRNTS
ncbi:PRPF39 [Lepeophtheirus salmonis]|uniref:PRPF39 n=1 Tax=Lepeophtheirus salmonis TaxID=72036 RepID=A0A7R8CAF3_LEPSM|nr:PRPF39 [Lepeophtheirus salmonis]CAF2750474.1 PRPF39 [Lepeophtheirus salmonis]